MKKLFTLAFAALLAVAIAAPLTPHKKVKEHAKKAKNEALKLYAVDTDDSFLPKSAGISPTTATAVGVSTAALATYMGTRINPDHPSTTNAVPEVASVIPLGIGLAALLRRKRK